MSVSVPLITDPNDYFLGTLPFVHTRARDEFLNSIRRAFDDTTGEPKSVRVMLHLSTRNGPTLMEMIANVVRDESELLAILMGRAIDYSLAGLLHHADNDADDGAESRISSLTAPSMPSCFPVRSDVEPYHVVHANEGTASQEDHASLGLLGRRIAELRWGVGSQVSPGNLSFLPCGISSDARSATSKPLSLRGGPSLVAPSMEHEERLADQAWDENESKISPVTAPACFESKISSSTTPKISSPTTPSGSTYRAGGESEPKASSITTLSSFESKISSLTTPSGLTVRAGGESKPKAS